MQERAAALFQTSLMRELLAGRKRRGDQIKADGGVQDPISGEFVTLADREKILDPTEQWTAVKRSASALRSLLAHEAQGVELYLMQPVLDRMRKDSRFKVVLWLHDGCYVTTGHEDELERKQIKRVIREVNARAAQAGIATILTSENIDLEI